MDARPFEININLYFSSLCVEFMSCLTSTFSRVDASPFEININVYFSSLCVEFMSCLTSTGTFSPAIRDKPLDTSTLIFLSLHVRMKISSLC